MHNPNSGLLPPVSATAQGRHVRVKKDCPGFCYGNRFRTYADGPFVVDDRRAGDLIAAGLVEACAPVAAIIGDEILKALHPAPQRAERAIAKPARA